MDCLFCKIITGEIPSKKVYEDENVTVVNKKQGMVTHPAAGNWDQTLVNALLYHWDRDAVNKTHRPGIVHRLDKDTSGIVIFAKNEYVQEALIRQMSSNNFVKEYLCVAEGIFDSKKRNY